MAQSIQFELITPEKVLLSEQVEMVVVPGSDGDFGVLVWHTLTLSTIRPGVLSIYRNGHMTERIFVTGGFVEVTGTTLTVLTKEVFDVDSIELVAVKQRLAIAKEALQTANTTTLRLKAESQVAVAESMLAIFHTSAS